MHSPSTRDYRAGTVCCDRFRKASLKNHQTSQGPSLGDGSQFTVTALDLGASSQAWRGLGLGLGAGAGGWGKVGTEITLETRGSTARCRYVRPSLLLFPRWPFMRTRHSVYD
jgi:hypothetical protein